MAARNPNIPTVAATHPIIPPNQRLPFIDPNTGILTPYGMQFLQQIYSSMQGAGGLFSNIQDFIDALSNIPILSPDSFQTPPPDPLVSAMVAALIQDTSVNTNTMTSTGGVLPLVTGEYSLENFPSPIADDIGQYIGVPL